MNISNFRDSKPVAAPRAPSYGMFEVGHASIPLSEWQAFRDAPPRNLVEEVIDRSKTKLPEYCVPLARGVAVASDALLAGAGYSGGYQRPRRWQPLRGDCSRGWDGVAFVNEGRCGGMLYTRRYGDVWNVE